MASDSNSSNLSSGEETKGSKGKTNQAVVDYLQAPRKKRKSYVVLATGPSVDQDTVQAIQRFMRTHYEKLSFVVVKSLEDLVKYSTRNIVLAIVDDRLSTRTETLNTIRRLKEQKNDGPMPTLFLTRESQELINEYQKILKVWHEVDEYIVVTEAARHAIFTKIKSGLEQRNQRRGRRYKVTIPIHFKLLDEGEKMFKGTILDFSIHGALLSVEEGAHHFALKDQILCHIPISQYIKGDADVFRVSAKVRRVLISGDKAGISWEYISETKVATMTSLLTSIVDISLAKSASGTRARIVKAQADANLTRSTPKIPT
jgi:hypothetical protein